MKPRTLNFTSIGSIGLLVVWILGACQGVKTRQEGTEQLPEGDNSRVSVDWDGTYTGVMPCADCEGIATAITLNADDTYVLETLYQKEGEKATTENGTFTWSDDGGKITLNEDGRKLLVGENRLFHLDQDGNRITGALESNYILEKVDTNTITDKYWKLVEIYGNPVPDGSTMKEPYIKLLTEDNRVAATGGCNGMGGTYELKDPNRISFSELMGTMMACENMEVETQLGQALQTADSYHHAGDTLQLFKARMAPLAKFKLVHVK